MPSGWFRSCILKRRRTGERFTHRFYRQHLGEPKATFGLSCVGGAGPGPVAIRDDGSIVLYELLRQDLRSYNLLALYPDGVLCKDMSLRHEKQLQPVYFIPLTGERLRKEDRVQVVPAGVKNFSRESGLRYPGEPYRFGDILAWIADSTLHTFNLRSTDAKSVKLDAEMHRSHLVTAFDGSTLVCGVYAFDASSGKLLGEPDYRKRPKNVAAVFAVRNRIGYYYDAAELEGDGFDLQGRGERCIDGCATHRADAE